MTRRPPIVIFNPDQWRGDVMGHLGNRAAVTPNLDRFARDAAVSFRHAYCQNPVCTPSRCSFMTGWYPHVRGHRTMYHMLHAEHGEPVLLKQLKDAGYFVWWGGKNDLVPAQDGYDRFCDVKFRASDEDLARWGHQRRGMFASDRGEAWRGPLGGDNSYSFFVGKLDTEGDSLFCDADWQNVLGAIDLIDRYDGNKPLCIYLPLTYPHPQYAVEEPWFSMIDRASLPPRTPTPDGWAGKPSLLRGIHARQNLVGWTEQRWTELRATYYGMCARVDHQFGLLVAALRRKGLFDDAAIFCFSDHGDFTGDYGLVEKTQNTFEDCLTRVPLLVKPPRGRPCQPRVSEALVELVDFTATAYDLAGIDPGYDHFGRSLAPLLAGETDEHRDAVFCEGGRLAHEEHCSETQSKSALNPSGLYWPRVALQQSMPEHTKATMCRTRDFKYVRRNDEPDELYDLRRDPAELQNRIDDPALRGVLLSLKDRMLTWYQQTCDVVPRQSDRRS